MTETAEAFERHLLDHLDDVAAWSAYADYLTEQGDPRGDFMRVQLALEDPSLDKVVRRGLQQEEETLRAGHLDEWLGAEMAADHFDKHGKPKKSSQAEFTFRRGWLWEADVNLDGVAEADLAALTSWRWLHTIDLTYSETSLAGTPLTRNLRVLKIGENEYHSTAYMNDLGATVAEVSPRLERLFLACGSAGTPSLFALPLVKLRELHVHCETSYAVEVLAGNPSFAALRTLAFHPHGYFDWGGRGTPEGAYLSPADVRLICESPHLAGLEHLQLNCVAGGDDAVTALIDSGRVFTLKSLNLTHGSVTDAGAQRLAAALGANPHRLERLVVVDNALSAIGVAAFSPLKGVTLDAGQQHAPDDAEYLTQGDFE